MLIQNKGKTYQGNTPRSVAMPAPRVPEELPDLSALGDSERIQRLEDYVRQLRESIAALAGQHMLIPGDA